MLRIVAISAGMGGVDYLLRAAGCAEHDHLQHTRDASSKGADYLLGGAEIGEPDGVWAGRGLEMLGVTEGQKVTAAQMRAVYGRLEHAETGEALGRRPRKFASLQERLAAAFANEPGPSPEQVLEITRQVRLPRAERLAAALAAEPGASAERVSEITAEVKRPQRDRLAAAFVAAGVQEERIAQVTRAVKASQRQAVGYYDLNTSPVKSISVWEKVLREAGLHEQADLVVAAHNQATKEMLDYIEANVDTTRVGSHKTVTLDDGTKRTVGEYARIDGLTMTMWQHSSSRDGDPHLHTHTAVLNRVQAEDGKIYALDGQQFKALKGTAAAAYERRVEELVTEGTGARFEWRPDGKAREIRGLDRELCDESSTRSAAIAEIRAAMTRDYVAANGHAPGRLAKAAIEKNAWRETRHAKSLLSPEAITERYVRKHGKERLAAQVETVAEAARTAATEGPSAGPGRDFASEDELLVEAVRRTQEANASWDETALALEINKLIGEVKWGADAAKKIDDMVARAVSPDGPADVVPLTGRDRVRVPAALRESGKDDGRPIYRAASSLRYATRDHVTAEQGLVAEAHLDGAPQLEADTVEAVRTELTDLGLSPDQSNAVMGVLTSGKAADTVIGPAGTGKSKTVGELDRVWRERFNAPVLGLATSQRATDVLTGEGLEALNTAAFLARYMPEDGRIPTETLAPGTMIVVDEAGMADTDKLGRIAQLVRRVGGKILYTGDHEQLAAVGSGGLLRLMVRDANPFHLTKVWRLAKNPWEQDASLKFRTGDAEAIEAYEKHGRLRGGAKDDMAAAAVRGYLADVVADRDTVLVTKTNADAAELSKMVRKELVDLGRVQAGSMATLADNNECGVGDLLQARKIDRNQITQNGSMVVNREILTAVGTNSRGQLIARRKSDGTLVYLSRDYVKKHLTLAYAGTVNSVQGRTTVTSHSLVERGMSRNGVYVEVTRGKDGNYLYVVTRAQADAHDHESYDLSAADVLREVLAADGGAVSAVETWRAELEAADSLQQVGALWELAANAAMTDRHHDLLLGALGPDRAQWLLDEDGHERLQATLRHAELSGFDVERLIGDAIGAGQRPLEGVDNMNAVLRSRLQKIMTAAGAPHVPGTWRDRLQSYAGAASEYARNLAEVMDDRAELMARAAVMAPPDWALVDVGPMPDESDMAARQEWAANVGAVGTYREMYGLDADTMGIGAAPSPDQDPLRHVVWQRAWEAMGCPEEIADHRTLSDQALREQIARWEREKAWAPTFVEEQFEAAVTLAEEYRRESVTRWAQVEAEKAANDGQVTPEVEELTGKAERADRMRDRFDTSARRMADLQSARDRWAEHNAEVEERARIAAQELDRRHGPAPVATEVQGTLLDSAGRPAAELVAEFEAKAVEGELLPPDRAPVVEAEVDAVNAELVEEDQIEDEPRSGWPEPGRVAVYYLAVDDAESGDLLDAQPLDQAEVDAQAAAQAQAREAEILDVEIVEEVTWDELEAQRAVPVAAELDLDLEAEVGDHGTRWFLDEITEADASYPEAEVDEHQLALFEVEVDEAELAALRIAAGRVREDAELSVKEAQLLAKLSDLRIDGQELRREMNLLRELRREEELRTERMRAERDAELRRQAELARDRARDWEPELSR